MLILFKKHYKTKKGLAIALIFVFVFQWIFTGWPAIIDNFLFSNRTPEAVAADTGFLSPSANAAITSSSGDNNGYQTNPTRAYDDGGTGSATDTNSGSNSNNSCTSTGADKHIFYNYNISIPAGADILGVEVRQDLAMDNLAASPFSCVQLSWDSGTSWTTAISNTMSATGETTYTYGGAANTWGRSWSISEFTNANFRVRVINGDTNNSNSNRDFSLDWIPVKVYYSTPTFTQSAYRLYLNNDSTDVGVPLAAQDAPATLTSTGQAFRLRMLLHVDTLSMESSGETFKLQYVDKGTGSCASPSGGSPASYTDVSATSLIAFNNNAAPTDGNALTYNSNDPTHGADTIVNQTYEEANNFTNSQGAVNVGQDGKWDFSLIDYDAFSASTYCFRVVKSDGTVLDTYSVYPQITTATKLCQNQLIGSDDSVTAVNLYEIAPKTATTKLLGTPSIAFQSWGSARRASDGLVFLVQYGANPNHLYSYNLSTGATVDIGSMGIGATNLVRLAFNGAGVLYGMDSGPALYSINTSTGAATLVCGSVAGILTGGDIAFNSSGTLYAMTGNQLYTIDIGACASTLIGSPGVNNLPSMVIDSSNNMYAFRYGAGTQQLYSINTSNGAGTLVGALSPGVNFYDAATCPTVVPDLSTSTKTDNDADNNVYPGQTITHTITIKNTGGVTGTGISVTDAIDAGYGSPGNFTFSNCGSSYVNSSGTNVSISGLEVSVGADCVINYDVTVDDPYSGDGTLNTSCAISAAAEGGLGAGPLTGDVLNVVPVPSLDQAHYRWRNNDGGEDWYDSAWGYRKRIVIDHTKISGSSDISNFAVLVSLTDTDLRTTSSSGHVGQSNGNDFLFTDINGSKLDHEIEKYVSTTGELEAWVKIPTLATSTDTNIFMYYGNAICADQQSISATWDSNYRMVVHLDETAQTSGLANDYQDSTSNANNGESMNGVVMDAVGKVDGADSFDNIDDYVACGTSNLPAIGTVVTLSVWAYFSTTPGTDNLILVDNQSSAAYQVGFRAGVPASWGWGGGIYVSSAATTPNVWHNYTYTYDGSTHHLYVDGVETANNTAAAQSGTPTLNSINTDRWGENFGGSIDEARISNIARSADWVSTEYNNQSSPSTFYSVSAEQSASTPATWAADEDTLLPSIAKGDIKRLRLEISNEGQAATTTSYRLEVSEANPSSCAAATYTRIDSSTDWEMATSTYIFDGEPTVNISPGLTDANTTFVTGQLKEDNDTSAFIALTATQFTELEYSLKPKDAAIDGAHYCFRLTSNGLTTNFVYSHYGEVSVGSGATLLQSAYRFFENLDGTSVSTALANQDSAIALTQIDQAFRLRLLLHVSSGSLAPAFENYKLQYAVKSGACDTAFSGETYSDVTTLTPIAYNDNSAPTDGIALTPNVTLDPVHGADTNVAQTYEEANDFTNTSVISTSQDGLWDLSLKINGAPSDTSYCLRVVKSTGANLGSYSIIPEVSSPFLYDAAGYYISRSYDAGAPTVFNTIEWIWSKSSPVCSDVNCTIRLQIKTAPDAGGVPGTWSSTWSGPDGEDGDETDYYTVSSGQMIHTDHNGDQWIKYKASFTGDQLNTPILEKVIINYQ
jgi:uncharacterized repeat protein (TIGR01451 family)